MDKPLEEWCPKAHKYFIESISNEKGFMLQFHNAFFLYLWYLNMNLPWRQKIDKPETTATFKSSHVFS